MSGKKTISVGSGVHELLDGQKRFISAQLNVPYRKVTFNDALRTFMFGDPDDPDTWLKVTEEEIRSRN